MWLNDWHSQIKIPSPPLLHASKQPNMCKCMAEKLENVSPSIMEERQLKYYIVLPQMKTLLVHRVEVVLTNSHAPLLQ